MTILTKKQKAILDYVESFIDDNGYAPSFREIAEHFGYASTATVADHIQALKDKGIIDGQDNVARSLHIIDVNDDLTAGVVPLMGAIAAGRPIEAIRTNETISIPKDMMGPSVFALKVRGDSMMDDGILDGDYVIIEKVTRPKNGDVVVALINNDEVTLKRFYQDKDNIRLQPANKNYKPIITKDVTIQGRVKGVIRRFAI